MFALGTALAAVNNTGFIFILFHVIIHSYGISCVNSYLCTDEN